MCIMLQVVYGIARRLLWKAAIKMNIDQGISNIG